MCDAFNNANDKIVNTVCNGNYITNISTNKIVCDIHTNGNVFLGFTMWDVHTNGNNWVFMPRPIAHEPACVPGGHIPDGFWVVWEGPPYRPHSLGDDSKCCRGKGLKPFV